MALSAGISRDGAWELLKKYNSDPFHLEHGEIVEQCAGHTERSFSLLKRCARHEIKSSLSIRSSCCRECSTAHYHFVIVENFFLQKVHYLFAEKFSFIIMGKWSETPCLYSSVLLYVVPPILIES